MWFEVAIIEGNTPFLLSANFLKRIGVIIDIEKNTLWSGVLKGYLQIGMSPRNLMMLDINEFWSSKKKIQVGLINDAEFQESLLNQEYIQSPRIFFFLVFGRCRTEARSLYEHKQSERHLYKDPGGPSKLANQNKPEKHKTNNHDDPQIPQPDLRFVKRKQQTRQKKRGKAQTNNHNKDLPKDTADLPLCHSTKACKMNYPPRHSVKHEDRSKNEWLRYQEWKTVH